MIACPSLRRAAAWRPLHPILCCSSRCLAVCSRTHASGSPDPLRVVQSKETLPPVVPPTLAGVLATKTSKSHTVRTESRNEYFQDFRRIIVKGGQGGSGVISYLPTQLRGLGPAAGGNGGRGGRIEVIADPAVASLSHLPKHLLGERGEDGRSKEQHGRDAPPTTVRVPVGTVIRAMSPKAFWPQHVAEPGVLKLAREQDAAVEAQWNDWKILWSLVRRAKQLKGRAHIGETLDLPQLEVLNRFFKTRQGYLPKMRHLEHILSRLSWMPPRFFAEPSDEVPENTVVASASVFPRKSLSALDNGPSEAELRQYEADQQYTRRGTPIYRAGLGPVLQSWELMEPGQKIILSPGGIAGRGNMHFVSHEMSSPQVACHGELPLTMYVTFELKSVADVGLVGLPNAGKSTVLSAVTRAHPKIAPYPFTTLNPYIGTVRFPDGSGFTIADIPGLVAGAAEDKGLGHRFLRHVVRSNVLVYMIDLARGVPEGVTLDPDAAMRPPANVQARQQAQVWREQHDHVDPSDLSITGTHKAPTSASISLDGTTSMNAPTGAALVKDEQPAADSFASSPSWTLSSSRSLAAAGWNADAVAQLRILQDELELYQQGFTRKPSIVIANKCDAFSDPVVGAAVLQRLVDSTSLPVIPISAKEGQNVTTMVAMLRQFVEDAAIARERSA